MKKTLCLMFALLLVFGFASAEGMRIAALKGPTAMGMVQMMAEASEARTFEICASADEIVPGLARGDLDVAALPANLASVLYNRTDGAIQVLAINTLGVLYIAERGEHIACVADLRGRTIYSAGKGSTPEFALNHILRANGLEPGTDVTIEYKAEHSECLAALMADAEAAAMLPQPFLTTAMMKAEDVRMALDLTAEWDALHNGESGMITGVVVVRRDYADAHADALAEFLADYAASVDFVHTDNAAAAELVGAFDIVPTAVAQKALPACNICCIAGDAMKTLLSGYLAVLFEADPASVGGALPDDTFYYGAAI